MTSQPTTKVQMLRLKEIRYPEDLKKLQEGQHAVIYCPNPITGILIKNNIENKAVYSLIRRKDDNSILESTLDNTLTGFSTRIVCNGGIDYDKYNLILESAKMLRQQEAQE